MPPNRTRRDCPFPGCSSAQLKRLANHLTQVHGIKGSEKKQYLRMATAMPQPLMKHGKQWRLIPEDTYNKLVKVSSDERPKPPVAPDVAQLDREKKRVEAVRDDPKLTDLEKVKRYDQAQHEYMRRYEDMIRPDNNNEKTVSTEGNGKLFKTLIQQLIRELRRSSTVGSLSPKRKASSSKVAAGKVKKKYKSTKKKYRPVPHSVRKPERMETRFGPVLGEMWDDWTRESLSPYSDATIGYANEETEPARKAKGKGIFGSWISRKR